MERPHSNAGRPSLACQRCRQRKIKCDLQKPRCGHCTKRGVDCVLPRRDDGCIGRGHVQALENRLAQLKREWMQSTNSTPRDATLQVVEGEGESSSRNDFMTPISVSTMGFPDTAPKQYRSLTMMRIVQAALDTWTDQRLLLLDVERYCDLPIAEAGRLMESYRHNIHALFPFVDLQAVRQSVDESLITSGLTTTLDSISSMVLAIGALLQGPLGSRNFYQILALVSNARRNMAEIIENESNKTIQILLLSTLFSLFDAGGGSSWHLIGVATQVALSLGLNQISQAKVSRPDFNVGLIEFWTTYVLDRVIALAVDKPFGISNDDITSPTDMSASPGTFQLSNLLELAHIASVWRTKAGSLDVSSLETIDARGINDACDLFYLFHSHIKTWFLGPPFPQFDRTPAINHYGEYIHLVGNMMAFRLPWVTGYSLLHSYLVKELVCLLVLQSEPENTGDAVAHGHIQHNAISALCSQFPSLSPLLMESDERRPAPGDKPPPIQNGATMRLWHSVRALKTSR